jgi:hypothetical protein
VAREIRISYINEKQEVIEQEILPVKADEGKTKVNINTFRSVIPKDKCNNVTEVFYISEGTRKALTGEDVTLDEIESVDLVCEGEEVKPPPPPYPTPDSKAKEEKYSWSTIAVFAVVAIVVVGTILYIIKCVGGGQAGTQVIPNGDGKGKGVMVVPHKNAHNEDASRIEGREVLHEDRKEEISKKVTDDDVEDKVNASKVPVKKSPAREVSQHENSAQDPNSDVAELQAMLSSGHYDLSELAILTIRLARQNKLNLVSNDNRLQLYKIFFGHAIAINNGSESFKLGVHAINALGRLKFIWKIVELRCGKMKLDPNKILTEDVLNQS